MYWDKSLTDFENSGDLYGQTISCLRLSRIPAEIKDKVVAENFLDQGLALAAHIGANELLKEGHRYKALDGIEKRDLTGAIRHLTLAEFYAEKLGGYQLCKFQTSVRQSIQELKNYVSTVITGRHIQVNNSMAGGSPVRKPFCRNRKKNGRSGWKSCSGDRTNFCHPHLSRRTLKLHLVLWRIRRLATRPNL